ncbi:3-isopropylmalate dehydratase small subunit [Phaeovulum sp. W22_SRMD_FR3]|uniref:3-isopropylmalate dehydratase small subunit n=1 Tax=Phaeovulum sp. W22_SRMD_FR3 TaxID=3240274 RepID=UPI003F98CA2D
MQPLRTVTGISAPLRLINIDTDMISPKQYLKKVSREGLAEGFMLERRFDKNGRPDPEFSLNQPRYQGASVLIAGDNFGCGSSREQAPWALLDAGYRCVISTSFGDIFHNNCFKNALLPVRVTPEQLELLFTHAETAADPRLTIDLEAQEIRLAGHPAISFTVDAYQRRLLLQGLDEVSLTEQRSALIDNFEIRRRAACPWIFA